VGSGPPAPFVPRQSESGEARFQVCWKKRREENQIKDDLKKAAAMRLLPIKYGILRLMTHPI
jgi:hypothetical protein